MPKTFMFLVIGLFFGTGFGFLIAATTGAELTGHDHAGGAAHDHDAHAHGDMDGTDHAHDTLIEAEAPVPTLMLHVLPDGPQSRNLHIMTTNFAFSPEGVNGDHVPGEGHAHVYVNGVKLPRAYSPFVHLDALPVGTHDIRVTLNANTHAQLAVDGTPVEAETTITIE